ncbi:MAG TPA: SOS response-associated peptidase family protein [Candidatus Bathyarchaeia archaeon]|nr:SOS response-associated peptidase family protein [Candidatus Bathyarchaeia archaeon]
MCARYVCFDSEDFKKVFGTINTCPSFQSYNIGPGTINPTILSQSPRQIVMMKWGLIPFWAKDPNIGYKTINARAEGIENKPALSHPD